MAAKIVKDEKGNIYRVLKGNRLESIEPEILNKKIIEKHYKIEIEEEKRKTRGNYVSAKIKNSYMNRNQLSKISGLSNSYIKYLESGMIKNPKRQGLIALGVALGLEFGDINSLLDFFGHDNVNPDDISAIIKIAKNRELTKNLQPIYGGLHVDLLLLAMDQIKGKLIVFNDKPPLILRSNEYILLEYGIDKYSVHSNLIEAIQKERMDHITESLQHNEMEYFTTDFLLRRYLERCLVKYSNDAKQASLRKHIINHIINTLQYMENDNFYFRIIESSPLFRFALKYNEAPNKSTMLFFVGHVSGEIDEYKQNWLRGYTSDDELLVEQFTNECNKFKPYKYDKCEVKEYIKDLLINVGKVSKEELNRLLSE